MIISKTPFRVSFCGGASDLPSFYAKHSGCVLSTTIDKYMYLSIHPYFTSGTTVLKYSKTESVTDLSLIEHKIFKYVLSKYNINTVEITSTADIPAGTGLGSSSSFTVGLLNTLYAYMGKMKSKGFIAEEACDIEINQIKSPIGKQDQYAAAYGGLNFYRFNYDGSVFVEPIIMSPKTYRSLQENLLMFYTGEVREANSILSQQDKNNSKPSNVDMLLKMCRLTEEMRDALQNNDIGSFGHILNESWQLKKGLASGISNNQIDYYYDLALKNGALGGKLLGAGGGGFLLFYCEKENQERLRSAISLKEMKFSFEQQGTSIIFIGDKYWE